MRGIGISLVIGFALGAVTVWLAGGGLTVGTAEIPPAPVEGNEADPPDPLEPPRTPPVDLVETAPGRGSAAAPRPGEPDRSWPMEELLLALAELVRGEGRFAGRQEGYFCQRIVREIREKGGAESRIPRELLLALLNSGKRSFVYAGLSGADLAEPPLQGELALLARSDPDPYFRSIAVLVCARVIVERPELAEVLLAAAADTHPTVRAAAVKQMGNLVRKHGLRMPSAFARVVIDATRDPDPLVRGHAAGALDATGRPGALRAVAMIREGVDDLELLAALAEAAACGGLAAEALGSDPSPELVTMIFLNLDWDDTAAVGRLAGLYGELLPLFQPNNPKELQAFFSCAIAAGDSSVAIETVNDPERRESARLFALLALLESERHVADGLEALRVLVWDDGSPASLKRDALAEAVWNFEEPGEHSAAYGRLLDEVIASHESRWVREAAGDAWSEMDWYFEEED